MTAHREVKENFLGGIFSASNRNLPRLRHRTRDWMLILIRPILVVAFVASLPSLGFAAGSIAGQAGKVLENPMVKREIERVQKEHLFKHADPADRKKIKDLDKNLQDIFDKLRRQHQK